MTNIEKVKRILDAGHWVKYIWDDGDIFIITSYNEDQFSYIDSRSYMWCDYFKFNGGTIEVIQRIPTPYKPGYKVLVLSNPSSGVKEKEDMVWKVMEIDSFHNVYYRVWNYDKSDWYSFPHHCLSPVFEDEEISDLDRIISGKEAKIVIDGKEYTCVIK